MARRSRTGEAVSRSDGGVGPRRICVVSSNPAAAEPRAPRHVLAARLAFPDAEVEFIDLAPIGSVERRPHPIIAGRDDIRWTTMRYPTRATSPISLAVRKARSAIAEAAWASLHRVHNDIFGVKAQSIGAALASRGADLYIAHNIETLLPAGRAAERNGAALYFDCMEYYSDMGDAQTRSQAAAARTVEAEWLSRCRLVLASSDDLADALAEEYSIARPLACYNTPPILDTLPPKIGLGLNLYWRNSVVGFGQRGLEDLLLALSRLPPDVRLFIQGRAPQDGGAELAERVRQLGLDDRVVNLGPYPPEEAVRRAAPYDIGLCPERPGPRNHELTVSNKLFDYQMAGLAVVASDLLSLRRVLDRSGGGCTFAAGNVDSLVQVISRLYNDRDELDKIQRRARAFALSEGNLEFELANISSAMRRAWTGGGNA